jgi:NAD(P)-dependent dehydrogenase (short-subunit alcohol dehydrogenase family)
MAQLDGKIAVVTGGSRGIGAAVGRAFGREGAAVVICDLLDERGEGIADDVNRAGGSAIFVHLDVTAQTDWQAMTARVDAWRGGIDVLVNNAGINVRTGIENVGLDDWNRVVSVNLTGPLLGMQTVAPIMRRRGGGAIVNIASNAALRGIKSAAYCASKWGVRGLTKVAALEFAAAGIRVNTVCPGVVPTELNAGQPYVATTGAKTPMGRIATAEEIAAAVLFLASSSSSFITGMDMPVDGGLTIGMPS